MKGARSWDNYTSEIYRVQGGIPGPLSTFPSSPFYTPTTSVCLLPDQIILHFILKFLFSSDLRNTETEIETEEILFPDSIL